MNKFIILGIFFLGLIPLIDISFQTEIQNDIFIFVQTSIRNSDGQLVTYLESSKFSHLNLPALNSFLDFEASQGSSPIITIDGKQYEIIRRVQSQSFDYEGLVASTILYDRIEEKPILLARFSHDGYQVIPGDVLESMWTFIRPVS
jgi:hypothetical protein